jgi:mannose-6-phosphate isomerase-like protein (cupin superfamily)
MKLYSILFIITACFVSFAAGSYWEKTKPSVDLLSKIYKQANVRKGGGGWGSIYIYSSDSTSTVGTESMLTAMLEFLPGKELQPPHQHVEEEFQFIIDGSGTWTLNGVESQITKGDLMYAKPGDVHGISNTGSDTLKFFVMKWRSKRE